MDIEEEEIVKKWEFFKAPIMAVVVVARMMPGIPDFNTRFLFYFFVVVPFLPILIYAQSFEETSIINIAFFYLIFYLISNVILTQWIKKVGKQWSEKEYQKLKPDQITFPFLLVLIINSSIHFGIFYLIIEFLISYDVLLK